MKILKNVITFLTILIFALSLLIIINVSVAIKNKKVPSLFGYSYMNVLTPSMEPVIKVDDLIIVKKASNYDVDDIVSFYYDINNDGIKEVITHQIVSKDNDIATTHGVNNPPSSKEEVNANEIIGKVIYKSTFLGRVLSSEIVTNKIYILSLIIFMLIIFIIFQIIKIYKIAKENEKDR